jgi:zinc transport system substrate-binding protein
LIKLTEEEHSEEEEHGHEHGDTDPHTWLSPKNYIVMAENLNSELEKR